MTIWLSSPLLGGQPNAGVMLHVVCWIVAQGRSSPSSPATYPDRSGICTVVAMIGSE